MDVDLVVPLKHPRAGKSRLRGAVAAHRHADLVLALACDTLAAVTSVARVRRVLVVTAEPAALSDLAGLGVELVPEPSDGGLNAALRYGEQLLRADAPPGVVGALQADLPALRAVDLEQALTEAAGRRAVVVDRQGTGTTLLLSAPGEPLDPQFGEGSAARHTASGAVPLKRELPSLRSDVDTEDDLRHAASLGLGKRTAALYPAGQAQKR
ncbi:2-phospho-L-lactate guanylyltransferase [Amycolatopsis jejuensis]|uniref:2-phospho-L-lactate guanylyltransferase n=1 Tax=Amycolatopsis jejuensis TaxID=330084 RepID=UPI0005260F25|nr:2-phospho-L-lactate guanylyltransferase [Amycolatopsis jejuensis]